MDEKEVNFSLSYEQLTRIAEEHIRECNLDRHSETYISGATEAANLLGFWYELVINGYASLEDEQRKDLIEADFRCLKKLIWPESMTT